MKVFVAGGTGAIGRHAVAALVEAGHDVTALARSPAKAAELAGRGATPVQVSLFDRAALASALAGHDAVVNVASAIPPMSRFMRTSAWGPNERVRRTGSCWSRASETGRTRVARASRTPLDARRDRAPADAGGALGAIMACPGPVLIAL